MAKRKNQQLIDSESDSSDDGSSGCSDLDSVCNERKKKTCIWVVSFVKKHEREVGKYFYVLMRLAKLILQTLK